MTGDSWQIELARNVPAIIGAVGALIGAVIGAMNRGHIRQVDAKVDATRESLDYNTERTEEGILAVTGLDARQREMLEKLMPAIRAKLKQAREEARTAAEVRIGELRVEVDHWREIAESQLAEHNQRIVENAQRIDQVERDSGHYPPVRVEPEKPS